MPYQEAYSGDKFRLKEMCPPQYQFETIRYGARRDFYDLLYFRDAFHCPAGKRKPIHFRARTSEVV